MILRSRFFLALLFIGLLYLGALFGARGHVNAAPVGTSPPEVRPQWLAGFTRDGYAGDVIASANGPNWTRLSNGDIVMFTVQLINYFSGDRYLLARRFSADGTLLKTRLLPPSLVGTTHYTRTIVANDPVTGDIVLMTGSEPGSSFTSPCRVLRLGSAFALKSSTTLPASGKTGCVAMQLLPDGSVIAADEYGLTRIDQESEALWSVRSGDDGRSLWAHDMLIDNNDVIWIASEGPYNDHYGAAVVRFDLQGMFLSEDYYLCSICISTTAETLDLQSDGSVLAAGGSASGQPGFLARYTANGQRLWVTDLFPNIGYKRLAHDASGATYALASTSLNTPEEVRRIDPTNGSVLWTVPAKDSVAVSEGIVVTRGGYPDIRAVGIDANGAEQWSHQWIGNEGGSVSRAISVNGGTEWLVKSGAASQPDCGNAPQVIALDAAGNPDVLARPCLMPYSTVVRSVDAQVGIGVLATLDNRIAAFTPDGDLRWNAYTCLWCADHFWLDAKLTADGGAWAIDYLSTGGEYNLDRLDAAGQTTLSLPIDRVNHPYALFGNDDQAIFVQADSQTLTWQRASLGTMALDTQTHTLSLNGFEIGAAHALSDGGVSVTLGTLPCDIMCPPPPPPNFSIVQLTADGELAWVTSFNAGLASLDDDGGAYVAVFAEDGSWHLQRVTPAGDIAMDIALPESVESVVGIYGPHAGRIVMVADNYPTGTLLRSLDENGNILATRSLQDNVRAVDDSPLGLLVSATAEPSNSTEWIDPASLDTLAVFRFADDGVADGSISYYNPWRLLSDGTVYGAVAQRNVGDLLKGRLARFSAPGYIPTELIFRNGFD